MSLEHIGNLDPSTVDALRELVEINMDSAKGLDHAADVIRKDSYSSLFRDLGVERQRFANELRDTLRTAGLEVEAKGSTLGAAHRWWIDLRDKLSGTSAYSVLDEAERGENHIVGKYEKLLPRVAGNPLNDVLLGQYEEIKSARDRIDELRRAEEHAG